MKTKQFPIVRWMRLEDLNEIEKTCSISKNFVKKYLEHPRAICSVATFESDIVGCILYKITKSKIILNHISTHPDHRKQKIASRLIFSLINKLSKHRNTIRTEVSEYNLEAQMFFKNVGFKAIEIVNNNNGDIYIFQYIQNL